MVPVDDDIPQSIPPRLPVVTAAVSDVRWIDLILPQTK